MASLWSKNWLVDSFCVSLFVIVFHGKNVEKPGLCVCVSYCIVYVCYWYFTRLHGKIYRHGGDRDTPLSFYITILYLHNSIYIHLQFQLQRKKTSSSNLHDPWLMFCLYATCRYFSLCWVQSRLLTRLVLFDCYEY